MTISGILKLKHDNDDYIMFSKGHLVNISEYLNCMLLDDVYIKVFDEYNKKILFKEKGQLIKEKIKPRYYVYHVNGANLDDILWNNVGRRLTIVIKNISNY